MNDKLKNFIETSSAADLAKHLSRNLRDYKEAAKDPNATLSMPSLDAMIEVSDELTMRLAQEPDK